MKPIVLTAAAPIVFLLSLGDAQAAHCFADVAITDGSGRTVTANRNWDRRTNGNRWRQALGNHRSECDGLGANHFNSIDLIQFARDNGMCGTITATGESWIGTSRRRGALGPRSVEVPCEQSGSAEDTSDYQYATKVVCGEPGKELLHEGLYQTLVNTHNPNYETVDFRFKFARADRGQDGEISYFTDEQIGQDGARFYDCAALHEIADEPGFIDGFFVVESRKPLDVVGYYSGGTDRVATLDVETTREREIENDRTWSCGNSREIMWRSTAWTVNGQPAVGVTHVNGTPIADFTTYNSTGLDGWLSTSARVGDDVPGGALNYRLPFCLCDSQEYPTSATVNIAGLRADNRATANIDSGTAFVTGANRHNDAVAGSGSQTVTSSGQHYVELATINQNDPSFHAVGFRGTIAFQNGHLGQCEAE